MVRESVGGTECPTKRRTSPRPHVPAARYFSTGARRAALDLDVNHGADGDY